MIIGAHFEHFLDAYPDKIALVCGKEQVNWLKAVPLVSRWSRLIAAKTPDHAAVALSVPNCAALPLLALAIARAGRNALVLDPAWPVSIQRNVCNQLRAALAITGPSPVPLCPNAISIDPDRSLASLSAYKFSDSGGSVPLAAPGDIFYTGFTSGSSGAPKAFSRNHRSWIESFDAEQCEFAHTPDDIVIAPGSLTHSLFLYAVLRALHIGATAIMFPTFRPNAVAATIAKRGGTILYGVPAQISLITNSASRRDAGVWRALRWIVSSGSKWADGERSRVRAAFPGAKLAEFYGASELSFVSVAREDEEPPVGSVGRAFANVEIEIVNDKGESASANQTGEIFVRSPMVFEGYSYGAGEVTSRRPGGFVSVGDMGYRDERGFLFLAGRRDRMIVSAGKNLYPEEIEQVLRAHPKIIDAAIIPTIDPLRGARIVAILQPARNVRLFAAEIIAFARQSLPLYKVPRRYYCLHDWPQTRSGKTDFAALQALLRESICEPLP